eukprot:CAMPEP_0205897266 /NCGR_PEP_ID=MMETSP1083-20121108/25399_1 /ASSEMBLY_ACC=CAM_ASM_000430 /TAXON_ID=97485 /ORGANISM="Prymnesium parvum, Strain Texoma1" /LENGTH=438 /DNA_ID=CAMNT_0053262401 /DNA_START=106 /DNA_END=1419 /DNA_ORIENTATION=-
MVPLLLAWAIAQVSSDPCAHLDDVDLWLCRATFHIPAIDVDTHSGLVHLQMQIEQLTCQGAKIDTFHTTADPTAGGGQAPTLSLALTGVAISCASPVVKFDHPIPLHTSIELSGPHSFLLNAIIDVFKGLIAKKIETSITDLVQTNLTAALLKGDALLSPLLEPPPFSPEPANVPTDAIDWRSSRTVQMVDFFLDDAIGAHGPLGVSGLIKEITGGSIALNGSDHSLAFRFALANLANASVFVESVIVSGMDSIFADADEADAHSLGFGVSVDSISLSANVSLAILPANTVVVDAPLHIEFSLSLTLNQLMGNATLFAPVNSSISLVDMAMHKECLHAALLGGGSAQYAADGKPRQGRCGGVVGNLDEFLNAVFLLINQAFDRPVRAAIDGVVGGPLRNMTDGMLESMLHNFTHDATGQPFICKMDTLPPLPPPSADA